MSKKPFQLPDTRQVRKEVVIEDMAEIIRRLPLTDAEVKTLYDAIMYRIPVRTCIRCGKLTPEVHSVVREYMGRHGSRICNGCNQVIVEKSV